MSLCPHGYTAFWDCPVCEEPMGTAPERSPWMTPDDEDRLYRHRNSEAQRPKTSEEVLPPDDGLDL